MQVSTETVYPASGGADSVNIKYDRDGLITLVGALKLGYSAGNNLLLADTLGGVITNYTYSTSGELASKEVNVCLQSQMDKNRVLLRGTLSNGL